MFMYMMGYIWDAKHLFVEPDAADISTATACVLIRGHIYLVLLVIDIISLLCRIQTEKRGYIHTQYIGFGRHDVVHIMFHTKLLYTHIPIYTKENGSYV